MGTLGLHKGYIRLIWGQLTHLELRLREEGYGDTIRKGCSGRTLERIHPASMLRTRILVRKSKSRPCRIACALYLKADCIQTRESADPQNPKFTFIPQT